MDLTSALDIWTKWHEFAAAVLTAFFAIWAWFSRRSSKRSADSAQRSAELALRSLHTTANQFAAELTIEADRMFIQHPEMRPYFEDRKPIADAVDETFEQRIRAGAIAQLDVMETIWDHHDEYDRDDTKAWREWMHDVLDNSPVVAEMFVELESWYPSIHEMLALHPCTTDTHEFAQQRVLKAERVLDEKRNKLAAAAAAGDRATRLKLMKEVAELEVGRYPMQAAELAAAYERYSRHGSRAGMRGVARHVIDSVQDGLNFFSFRLHRRIDRLAWGPPEPLPAGLRRLLDDPMYATVVEHGQTETLESAIDAGTKRPPPEPEDHGDDDDEERDPPLDQNKTPEASVEVAVAGEIS